MRDALIPKTPADLRVVPNMVDWAETRAAFSWDRVRDELVGSARNFNIASLAVDRHAAGARSERVALRFLRADGQAQNVSFKELQRQSNRFANGLRQLGVGKGDKVFVLAGRIPELYVAVLGGLKNGSVV
ncbi:MAG TPA: AMP-binding protein, partial [Albitalea sp.]|nr:AMP-binding protein [Albitalea sp.]